MNAQDVHDAIYINWQSYKLLGCAFQFYSMIAIFSVNRQTVWPQVVQAQTLVDYIHTSIYHIMTDKTNTNKVVMLHWYRRVLYDEEVINYIQNNLCTSYYMCYEKIEFGNMWYTETLKVKYIQ